MHNFFHVNGFDFFPGSRRERSGCTTGSGRKRPSGASFWRRPGWTPPWCPGTFLPPLTSESTISCHSRSLGMLLCFLHCLCFVVYYSFVIIIVIIINIITFIIIVVIIIFIIIIIIIRLFFLRIGYICIYWCL